jgi:hypothetical protein
MYLGQEPSNLNAELSTFGGAAATSGALATGLTATAATGIGALVAGAIGLGLAILSQVGKGRREADAIVPVQNAVGQRLDEINRSIPNGSVPQLQGWWDELRQTAAEFRKFVGDPRFTDGRASRQALDTIMPLIDGTDSSGYPCITNQWGNPCNGGTMGTIERQLYSLGAILSPPQLTQGGMGPSLQTPLPGLPMLPQSGYLAPTSPYSSIQSAGIIPVSSSDTQTLLAAGGALLLLGVFFSRRKGRS